MHTHRAAIALLLVPMLAIAGCKGREAASQDSAAGAAATPDSAQPATATAPALTDPNIVYILDEANASDSARGQLAITKGTNADVKAFARLMVGEHHALRLQGQQLATKLSVTPQAPSGDQSEAQAKQIMDSLQAAPKGKAWDKAYIDYEVTYHQAVLETATKALNAAQNQELKDLIQKAAPVIQHHLERAQQIQKALGT